MKKKFLSLLVGLMLGGQTLQAVDNTVAVTAGLGGFFAALGVGYKYAKSVPLSHEKQAVYACAVLGGLVWAVGWISEVEYFKYIWINGHLDFLECKGPWVQHCILYEHKNYLFNVELTDENFDTVLQETDCESVDFPLIVMFKKLQKADELLIKLRKASDLAMFNTIRKSSFFYKKLQEQRIRLDGIIKRVRDNISKIKQHGMWTEQWKMYQTTGMFEKVQLQVAGISNQ